MADTSRTASSIFITFSVTLRAFLKQFAFHFATHTSVWMSAYDCAYIYIKLNAEFSNLITNQMRNLDVLIR